MKELARRVSPRIRSDGLLLLILGYEIWEERLQIRAKGREVWMMIERVCIYGPKETRGSDFFCSLAASGFLVCCVRSTFHHLVNYGHFLVISGFGMHICCLVHRLMYASRGRRISNALYFVCCSLSYFLSLLFRC